MNVEIFVLGVNQTNCYVVWDENEAIIFDPADHPDLIIEFIESRNLSVKYVINTHGHFDHILGNNVLVNSTGAKLVINRYDADMLTNAFYNLSAYMIKPFYSVAPSILVNDGDTLEIGGKKFVCIHTPGHTQGASCFYFKSENVVFTGDTLFKFSFGRTDLVGGDYDQMRNSLKKLLNTLKDGDLCFPGHGESFKFGEVKSWIEDIIKSF